MRKISRSSNTPRRMSLSARADSRSRPNGFSTTTRAPAVQPALASCSTTKPNREGGIAR